VPVAELALGPDAGSAGEARRFLVSTLGSWGKSGYQDDAVLLLSELVTNAALHARTEIMVRIELRPECLRLAVTDGSPRQPVVRRYSDQATTGRGLNLIITLARRWGIDPHPDGGKTVWAELGRHQKARRPKESTVDLSVFPNLEDPTPGDFGSPGATSARHAAA
jgi:anti-sigma regulatory factor (Ser/Thr protein kinase)